MIKEKEWFCEIKLSFAINNYGETKKEFIQNVKDNFYEEHNIELTDKEIVNIEDIHE
tara:strand:+ start:634 stop:804 length:171 start_codon:yes stop_codon:yes gene_type:complete